MIYLTIAIIFAFSVVAFALGNNDIVSVKFLFWEQESSLALLLLVVFTLGVLTALLTVLPSWFRKSMLARKLKGELQKTNLSSQDVIRKIDDNNNILS